MKRKSDIEINFDRSSYLDFGMCSHQTQEETAASRRRIMSLKENKKCQYLVAKTITVLLTYCFLVLNIPTSI